MRSATPKVLHRIGGRTLLGHAIAAAEGLNPERLAVVVRHRREIVAAEALERAPHALIADQDDVPGTGRAVWCAVTALDAVATAAHVAGGTEEHALIDGDVVVTSADVPLVDAALLVALLADHQENERAVTVVTAKVTNPSGYGRIVRDSLGDVEAIVEHKDASPEQLAINEINAGLYVFDAHLLRDALGGLDSNNAQGELYLTDVVKAARAAGKKVGGFVAPDAASVEGVNDRVQLAAAGKELNRRIVEAWMRAGVTITDPATTWIDVDVTIAQDATILPGTHLTGSTAIGADAVIGPDTTLSSVVVGERATVSRSQASDSSFGADSSVGPFSYVRPGTVLGEHGKIGTYVETKNAQIGAHSKVPHLSYVGDATVGEHSNIGAATIFVNYDGVSKARSSVGDHVRIGSDNMLIAPVTIGDGAYTGAGAIIRRDVPPGAMSRNASPQQIIEGWVQARRPGTASADAASKASGAGDPEPISFNDNGDPGRGVQ